MRTIYQYSVVFKIMRDFDEEQILNWLDKVKLEGLDEYVLYQSAHSTGRLRVLAKLLESKKVAGVFNFVSDLTDNWIQSGEIEKLEYPQIQTKGLSFVAVIKLMTGEEYNKYILKVFSKLVRAHGIKAINDVLLLQNIYGRKNFKFAEFFRLDHALTVPRLDMAHSIYLDPILQKYSYKRTIHLLKSATEEEMKLISHNLSLLGQHMRMEVLTRLPKKPKSMHELNHYLVKELAAVYPPEMPLHQKIACFNNQMVSSYQIWIPAVVQDLRNAAGTLENCLDHYISRVMGREVQVMILLEKGIPKYAVEIERKSEKYVVTSMKGKKNSEVEKMVKIREELYKILDRAHESSADLSSRESLQSS